MARIALPCDQRPHGGPDDGWTGRGLSRPGRASDPFGPVAVAFGVVTWLLLVTVAAIAPAFW